MSGLAPSYLLLLQLAVIVGVAGVLAALFHHFWQPPVVAQMVGGLILGPSLLGALAPNWQHLLFPRSGLTLIEGLGQLGVVLYMFVAGNELDHLVLRDRARGVLSIATASLILPLLCGLGLALLLAGDGRLFPGGVPVYSRALFLATALAVTAFPVLARIIDEIGLSGTVVGHVALGAGAVTDAGAWCLLAVTLASAKGQTWAAAAPIVGTVAFVTIALLVGRPLLRRVAQDGQNERSRVAVVLIVLMVGAFVTAAVGVQPALGAFVVGAVAPRTLLMGRLRSWLGPPSVYLLLPVFFVSVGLQTSVGAVLAPDLIAITVFITLVASASKAGGCYLAARISGMDAGSAAALGSLMNARGLVGLVMLTIGLQQGLITTTFFSVMVCVAILTTVSAGPGARFFSRSLRIPATRLDANQVGVLG